MSAHISPGGSVQHLYCGKLLLQLPPVLTCIGTTRPLLKYKLWIRRWRWKSAFLQTSPGDNEKQWLRYLVLPALVRFPTVRVLSKHL